MLLIGRFSPDRYYTLMQEDRFIEWATVWLFLAAGLIGLRNSIRNRRWLTKWIVQGASTRPASLIY